MPKPQYLIVVVTGIVIMMLAAIAGMAQTPAPNAVYYVCAEQGFKLSGPAGYDHYQWSEGNTGMPGADSGNIRVNAMGAAAVGNSYVARTYHLKVQNNGGCWSDQATYVVYVMPKLQLSVSGYMPPYCENLSHDITLTAALNGGAGTSALTLPQGVSVKYTWIVEPYSGAGASNWNAAILGATNLAAAQVLTPQTSTVDNNYTVKVEYSYPATVNVNTDVVGNCGDEYTQNVHADPKPVAPMIHYEAL